MIDYTEINDWMARRLMRLYAEPNPFVQIGTLPCPPDCPPPAPAPDPPNHPSGPIVESPENRR